MPGTTLTGWKHRIRDYCDTQGIPKTDSQVSRMAVKISKRMTAMNEELDFYEALRVLGMSTDTTARNAVRNIEHSTRTA